MTDQDRCEIKLTKHSPESLKQVVMMCWQVADSVFPNSTSYDPMNPGDPETPQSMNVLAIRTYEVLLNRCLLAMDTMKLELSEKKEDWQA